MPNIDESISREHENPTTSSTPKSRFCCNCRCLSPLIPIILDSFKIIFLEHPKQFLTIYAFTTLPLSLLLTSLSLSSRHLKARVAHLEWLANVVPTWVEADNVRAEARKDTHELLRLKTLHAFPILVFSILALISCVSVSTVKNQRPTVKATVNTVALAVKVTWVRPFLTCIVNFAVHVAWELAMHLTATVVGYPRSVAVTVVGAAAEVYIMAVLGLALVVSVVEEQAGLGAVRVGLGLMKERWLCGWVLSGLVLVGSGCIGWEMEGLMDGQDLSLWEMTRVGYMGWLVVLLGWVVLFSYVVVTVFYIHCRKFRHVISRDDDQLDASL